MNAVSTVARYLLGVVFVVFGLNGFWSFMPTPPMPPLAVQFVSALMQSHYMAIIFVIEVLSGVLLLTRKYVPQGLALLAPVIVNIVLFHGFLAPSGLPVAIFVSFLWMAAAYRERDAFAGLFRQSPERVTGIKFGQSGSPNE